mgnify:CR=1 FL=1
MLDKASTWPSSFPIFFITYRIFIMSFSAQPFAALWLLLSVALVGFVVKKHRDYRRLQAFPGPVSTGWTEVLHTRAILSRRSHAWYKQVTDQYGE